MTTQEAYETQRAYFTRPGAELARHFDELVDDYVCSYRTPDGEKCAVGCLIPDELYQPEIEGEGPRALMQIALEDMSPLVDLLRDVDLGFLADTQTAHDEAMNAADFVCQLDLIAANYDLRVVA